MRYLNSVGNFSIASPSWRGSSDIGICAASRNIWRRRPKNERIPASSCGNSRMWDSMNGSSPMSATRLNPSGMFTRYSGSMTVSVHSSSTPR